MPVCKAKGLVCDLASSCPYDNDCKMYEAEVVDLKGLVIGKVCKGEDELLRFISGSLATMRSIRIDRYEEG
jgi:hypothetical protein